MPQMMRQEPPTSQFRRPGKFNIGAAAAGAAGGFAYAQQTHSAAPLVFIVWGAALGFFCLALAYYAVQLIKWAAITALLAVMLNYMILVPFGWGNHLPLWLFKVISTAQRIWEWLLPHLPGR